MPRNSSGAVHSCGVALMREKAGNLYGAGGQVPGTRGHGADSLP
jgi:hypothetical protein